MTTLTHRLALMGASLLLSAAAHAAPDPYSNVGQEAPSNSFVAASSGALVAHYTGLAGGNLNFVGVSINGVDGPTGLSDKSSAYGETFVLGQVTAGDSLVFFIDTTDGTNPALRFYSDKARNGDGKNHAWATAYAGDTLVPAGLHIAFEDLNGGGDFNYADHGIVVTLVTATPVPEPASWALLLGGVAGIAALRRRR
ncbi:PEP-CTERM sorting domain-containing protein [Roseateles sp. P5_E7]